MQIAFVEIGNFRKLKSVRVELNDATTLFVGANNSGKTSAMLALRYFLSDASKFNTNDFTLFHWDLINKIGSDWENADPAKQPPAPTLEEWKEVLPFLDVWFEIAADELHYVSKLLPDLDYQGGLVGVRLRYQPEKVEDLRSDYLIARNEVKATIAKQATKAKLWPATLLDFLSTHLRSHFKIAAYVLDPNQLIDPADGVAAPQNLPVTLPKIDGDPLKGLVRVNDIPAQRGLGDQSAGDEMSRQQERRESRKLSDQIRAYYLDHLNHFDKPDPSDLLALEAIDEAQKAFDERLELCFQSAINEVQDLGYPGVTDPKLKIATKLRPIDGLNHEAAVRYEVAGDKDNPLLLPESYNGLGYQNLISIIFRLMAFRDAWMRVGKAKKKGEDAVFVQLIEPLHLVLVEEPEAHLHAQVQQVFMRKAYGVLRNHTDLGAGSFLKTQMVVSTHSSHVAHEVEFKCLRYFRRLPAALTHNVPTSKVVNLSRVFGAVGDTQRFVTRYLKATHCDLFFADAAILVEGPAERILVPFFIRKKFTVIHESYVTVLEIGGSHAHRFRELIEALGITTLVVTDIDAVSPDDATAVAPETGKGHVSANSTLQSWLPKKSTVDDLSRAKASEKCLIVDELFGISAVYQTELAIGGATIIPSTFEDALAFANLELLKTLHGTGLIAAFKKAILANSDMAKLAQALFGELRKGNKKADFALDLLYMQAADKLEPPQYLLDGLSWLQERIDRRRHALTPLQQSLPSIAGA